MWIALPYLGMSRLVGSRHTQDTQRYSQDGSSDAAFGYLYCSNLLLWHISRSRFDASDMRTPVMAVIHTT